jgi:hypothetical protein
MMPMRRPTRGKCALLAQETYYKDNLKSDLLSCFQVDFILKTYRVILFNRNHIRRYNRCLKKKVVWKSKS